LKATRIGFNTVTIDWLFSRLFWWCLRRSEWSFVVAIDAKHASCEFSHFNIIINNKSYCISKIQNCSPYILFFFLGLRFSAKSRLETDFWPKMLFFWFFGMISDDAYLCVKCYFDFFGDTFLEIVQRSSLGFFLDLLVLTK
jgi:hypothetical protein